MSGVIDAFMRVLPRRSHRSGTGWINFNCPACGDNRNRGGFLPMGTGGFRYYCFNGGCEYQIEPTGWEPGGGLGGRPRRLFEMLGGDIMDIPYEYLIRTATKYDEQGQPIGKEELEATYDFPEVAPPEGSDLLTDATGQDAEDVRKYLLARGKFFLDEHPFLWSPKFPRYVITPFMHTKGKMVGWIARAIDKKAKHKHLKCANFPRDYLLNQHRVNERSMARILVMEDSFDAIALRGIATFGPRLSMKQVNLLRLTGKDIVVVPDYQKNEWQSFFNTARANHWYIAAPRWPGDSGNNLDHIKDPGDSIKRNGRLATIETLIGSITNNYLAAETALKLSSGEKVGG